MAGTGADRRVLRFSKHVKVGGLLVPLVLLAVLPAPASAYPRPGITDRVSVASNGAEAEALFSTDPDISGDGRYVAFRSAAPNLVAGDTNNTRDIFVHDHATGITERVSLRSDGTQVLTQSFTPVISTDGRHVAFQSPASIVPESGPGFFRDVFVHDRATGATDRVSVASNGAEANHHSDNPAISADGRYVAFSSLASNLVPGDTNGRVDVFVHDRATGTTERVSVASDGAEAESSSFIPAISAISADGGHVAFTSPATNLVPGDTNGTDDVFVHDRATGTTERVSVASDGAEANSPSTDPAISADGAHVAFSSPASNLVPGDTNGIDDGFVHHRPTGATERVSVASDGAEGNRNSNRLAISVDGAHVAFSSSASNLVPGDTNGVADVFLHDRGGSLGVVGVPSVVEVPGGVGMSGRATFAGAALAEAPDPEDDGTAGGPVGAANVGAELTGAALIYRPEQEDLLLRLDLSSLPSDPAGAGLSGVVYGADLRVGETRYEVRVLRAAATSTAPRTPYAALFRCDLVCAEHAPLTGSLGTTGEQVLVSVPLSALGAAEGTELTELRAFTAAGEATPGALLQLDEIPLTSSLIPTARVELGIADASTPEGEVAFTVDADLLAGEFAGTIPTAGLSPGSHRLWARACLGDACGPAAAPVTLGDGTSPNPSPSATGGTAYYFHSATSSNNLDQIAGSAHFDSISPTSEEPATAIDVPVLQNASDVEVLDPVWRGQLSDPATSLTVDFWGRSLPDQATGRVNYTVRVSTGGGHVWRELTPAINYTVPLGTDFSRITHWFDGMVVGGAVVPLDLPSGPFKIAIRGTFSPDTPEAALDNAATEIRFDSVDFPSGFTTLGEREPTPMPTESPAPDTTEVVFTADSENSGQHTDETLFEARLADSAGDPVVGATLTFTLTGEESSRDFTATTDPDGVASVTPTLTEKPGPYQLTVRYDGDDERAPSVSTTGFVVASEDSDTELTVEGTGNEMSFKARLSDLDAPSAGIAGRTIDFYSDGELIGSEQTDSNGAAAVAVPPGHRGANRTYEAVFAGDDFYRASSDARPGQGGEAGGITQVDRSYPGALLLL